MDVVLHIGMRRTGTTFLQEEVFANLDPDIVHYWRFRENDVGRLLLKVDELEPGHVRSRLRRDLVKDRVNLVSEENIYFKLKWKNDDRYKRIDRIHRLLPGARIIFGTRNEDTLMVSLYSKYVVTGGPKTYKEFLMEFDPQEIDTGPYIRHLKELWGEDNVYLYRFEELMGDVEGHVKGICDFIGAPVPKFQNTKQNVGYSLWQIKLALPLNKFFKTKKNPNGLFPLEYHSHPHRLLFQSARFPKALRGRKAKKEDLIKL